MFAGACDSSVCAAVERALIDLPTDVPGVRIGSAPALHVLLSADGSAGRIAAAAIGPAARAVRAVLFDKTAATNWSLAWHQDRTIVVQRRADVAGYGPWTIKSALVQVEPPFAIIERMVTLRLHLDPVDDNNAPLRVVPGSHSLGRIAEGEIEKHVRQLGERTCLAERGDIWLYATPILHASRAADPPRRRRVLQVDYAADALPAPLDWRGV